MAVYTCRCVTVCEYITQTPSLSRDIRATLFRVRFHFHESCLLSFSTTCLCEWMCAGSFWASRWFCSLFKCHNYNEELLAAAICLCFSFHFQQLSKPDLSVMCMRTCVSVHMFVCMHWWLWLVYFAITLCSIATVMSCSAINPLKFCPYKFCGDAVSGLARPSPGHWISQAI